MSPYKLEYQIRQAQAHGRSTALLQADLMKMRLRPAAPAPLLVSLGPRDAGYGIARDVLLLAGAAAKGSNPYTTAAGMRQPIRIGVLSHPIVATAPLNPGAPNTGLLGRQGLSYELKHLNKHLADTPEALRLIRKEDAAHVFSDKATLSRVEQAILERRECLGTVRGWERYGMRFEDEIGYRIDAAGKRIPLHYGELKLNPATGQYHVIPRTGPSS